MADGPSEPIILGSDHRHGVTEDDMLPALRFAVRHVRQTDDMVMFIGPDAAGTLIEVEVEVEVGVVIWWGRRTRHRPRSAPTRTKCLR